MGEYDFGKMGPVVIDTPPAVDADSVPEATTDDLDSGGVGTDDGTGPDASAGLDDLVSGGVPAAEAPPEPQPGTVAFYSQRSELLDKWDGNPDSLSTYTEDNVPTRFNVGDRYSAKDALVARTEAMPDLTKESRTALYLQISHDFGAGDESVGQAIDELNGIESQHLMSVEQRGRHRDARESEIKDTYKGMHLTGRDAARSRFEARLSTDAGDIIDRYDSATRDMDPDEQHEFVNSFGNAEGEDLVEAFQERETISVADLRSPTAPITDDDRRRAFSDIPREIRDKVVIGFDGALSGEESARVALADAEASVQSDKDAAEDAGLLTPEMASDIEEDHELGRLQSEYEKAKSEADHVRKLADDYKEGKAGSAVRMAKGVGVKPTDDMREERREKRKSALEKLGQTIDDGIDWSGKIESLVNEGIGWVGKVKAGKEKSLTALKTIGTQVNTQTTEVMRRAAERREDGVAEFISGSQEFEAPEKGAAGKAMDEAVATGTLPQTQPGSMLSRRKDAKPKNQQGERSERTSELEDMAARERALRSRGRTV